MKLLYNPLTGRPFRLKQRTTAAKFQAFHTDAVWPYDPWTGIRRDPAVVHFDCYGWDIEPPKEELDPQIVDELYEFLTADTGLFGRSKWFENHQLKVYARNSNMYIGKEVKDRYRTNVISNVTVHRQGQGLYRQLIALFEACAQETGVALIVESVMNPTHHRIYERRGFTKLDVCGDPRLGSDIWFYKLPEV